MKIKRTLKEKTISKKFFNAIFIWISYNEEKYRSRRPVLSCFLFRRQKG